MFLRTAKALVGPTLRYRVRSAVNALGARRPAARDGLSFVCNVCAAPASAPLGLIHSDEPSCRACGSSTRFRAMVHGLSLGLFGQSRPLRDFPVDRQVKGAGMTDWIGYASRLATKFDYVNTFYHQEPRIDITGDCSAFAGRLDFLLSSDVMEHVRPPVARGFANALTVLKPGGVFVVSVPCSAESRTREHFPDLHDYEVLSFLGRPTLVNRTVDGRYQVFDDLVFHGGPGAALELRCFSVDGFLGELHAAGFVDVRLVEDMPAFGILTSDPPQGVLAIARRPGGDHAA